MLSLTVVFAVVEYNARNAAEQRLRTKLGKLVSIQSAVLSDPLWNLADDQLALSLSALALDDDVLAAAVFDNQGGLVASIGDTGLFERQLYVANHNIVHFQNDEAIRIGTLTVALGDTLTRTESIFRLWLALGLAMVLLVSVIGATLVAHHRIIGIPLRRLLRSIKAARTNGLHLPVEWRSRDEIGAVVAAFNELHGAKQINETALRTARDELDKRVQERTEELAKISHQLNQAIGNFQHAEILTDAEFIEPEDFTPDLLDLVALTARDVSQREQRLKHRVQTLQIQIDETRQKEQIKSITGTDYFKDLRARASDLRASMYAEGSVSANKTHTSQPGRADRRSEMRKP